MIVIFRWLSDSTFVSRLRKDKNLSKVFCMLCMKTFSIKKDIGFACQWFESTSQGFRWIASLRFANKEDQPRVIS